MIRKEMLPDGELSSLRSWGAKLTGSLLRIAGILHVVEHKDKVSVINKETMLAAKDLTTKLISHAQSAHHLLGMDERQKNARIVLEWMTKNCRPIYSTTEIRRGLKNRSFVKQRTRDFTSQSKLDDALSFLLDMNIFTEVKIEQTTGRPVTYYITNPRAFDDRVLYDNIGLPLNP